MELAFSAEQCYSPAISRPPILSLTCLKWLNLEPPSWHNADETPFEGDSPVHILCHLTTLRVTFGKNDGSFFHTCSSCSPLKTLCPRFGGAMGSQRTWSSPKYTWVAAVRGPAGQLKDWTSSSGTSVTSDTSACRVKSSSFRRLWEDSCVHHSHDLAESAPPSHHSRPSLQL